MTAFVEAVLPFIFSLLGICKDIVAIDVLFLYSEQELEGLMIATAFNLPSLYLPLAI